MTMQTVQINKNFAIMQMCILTISAAFWQENVRHITLQKKVYSQNLPPSDSTSVLIEIFRGQAYFTQNF